MGFNKYYVQPLDVVKQQFKRLLRINEFLSKKERDEMYPKSVSKRTGPWTSKEIDIQENYL